MFNKKVCHRRVIHNWGFVILFIQKKKEKNNYNFEELTCQFILNVVDCHNTIIIIGL